MATDTHDRATAAMHLPAAGPRMFVATVAGIVASLTNPRKTFDQAKLRELADSIAASGVHQPILVRPLPPERLADTSRAGGAMPVWPIATTRKDEPIEYELVAGERRWRACQLAGVAEIPVMARPLSDDQVLEIQIIENLQREDVSPLEEAEGYGALMRQGSGMDADAVGAKIGKSRSYVYARLKLLDLCPMAREALAAGEIDNSRALRIARIPAEKAQITALKEACRRNHRGDFAMGVREFEGWLQRNVMLRLEDAPFPIAVVGLVPGVGACGDCPKRTGAEPELFADVDSPDLCTDPTCHAAKAHAHAEALRAAAEAKGMRIIEGKEAKAIVRQHSYDGYGRCLEGYTRLEATRADAAQDGKMVPLRTLLGSSGPQPVLIEDPYSKELIEAVPTDEAEAVLVQRGAIKTTSAKIDVKARIEQLGRDSKTKQARAVQGALYAAAIAAAHHHPAPEQALTDAELLREILKVILEDLDGEDICEITGIEPIEGDRWLYSATIQSATARIDRATDSALCTMMLACLVWQHSHALTRNGSLLRALARALGFDAEAIASAATAAEKAELKDSIARLRAAAKAQDTPEPSAAPKAPLPHGPAAPASAARRGGKAQKAPAARAGGEAPKTSAAHASAQIAEALSALEVEHDQAPAAQGIETPPVPAGQAAASAPPQDSRAGLTPAAAQPSAQAASTAQAAACAAAPGGQAGAGVGTGAATQEGGLAVGAQVRILPTATGKRQAPHVGKEGKIFRRIGPDAWDVALPREKRSVPIFVAFHTTELEAV